MRLPPSLRAGSDARSGLRRPQLTASNGDSHNVSELFKINSPDLEYRLIIVARQKKSLAYAGINFLAQLAPVGHSSQPRLIIFMPMRIGVKNGDEYLAAELLRVSARFHIDAACSLYARLGPVQISKMGGGWNFDTANMLKRKPDVFSLQEDFHHAVDRIVGVSEILERRAVQRSAQYGRLLGGAVQRGSRLVKVACSDLRQSIQL